MIYTISETAIGVEVQNPGEARQLADILRRDRRFREVVPGLASVAVEVSPGLSRKEARGLLEEAGASVRQETEGEAAGRTISLPIRYGSSQGPDLEDIASACNLTPTQLIERHASPVYTAEILGFTPGFAYMSGLDRQLYVRRLNKPRVRVPAGSVGVAAGYCGVYALDGPGGWPLIGQVEKPLVDWCAEPPFVVVPGTKIRFEPC